MLVRTGQMSKFSAADLTGNTSSVPALKRWWPLSSSTVDTSPSGADTITEVITNTTTSLIQDLTLNGTGYTIPNTGALTIFGAGGAVIPALGTSDIILVTAITSANPADTARVQFSSDADSTVLQLVHNTTNAILTIDNAAGDGTDVATYTGTIGAAKTWIYVAQFHRDTKVQLDLWNMTDDATAMKTPATDSTLAVAAGTTMGNMDNIRLDSGEGVTTNGAIHGIAVFEVSDILPSHITECVNMAAGWVAGDKTIPGICGTWT